MAEIELPVTTSEQPPAFTTAAECDAWIKKQAAEGPVMMQAALLRQLNLLNRYALPAKARLAVMETLRGPLHAAQEDNARRFVGKPLPLAASEQSSFDTCLLIWNALANGYLHCVAAGLADEADMQSSRALASQRALAALAAAQFDSCRGGRALPASHWRRLHQAYAAAEKADVARQEVADEIRLGRNPATPVATWVEALLLHCASLHELPPRQMAWVLRWAQRWAGKVNAFQSPPTMSARAIPLCADVDSEMPAGYRPVFVTGARFLDTSGLRNSIKKRLAALDDGESPKALQLGDDCAQPACQQLLTRMYFHWCKGGTARRHERQEASGVCTIIGGMEAIHYYLSGRKPMQKSDKAATDSQIRRQRDQIATFGRIMEPRMDDYSEQHGYRMEQWQIMEEWHMLDRSATGARIIRPADKGSGRFVGSQLVAAKPADAKELLLGTLRWVMVDATNTLQAGVEIMVGKPQPVAVRTTEPNAAGDKFAPGFLLPAMPELGLPQSIVTPPGFFRLERVLDLLTGSSSQIRLTGIIDRGSDFERSTYV